MKKREFEEIKSKTETELLGSLGESREKLRVLKFDLAAGKVKNIRQIRELKKNVARLLTLLKLKQKE